MRSYTLITRWTLIIAAIILALPVKAQKTETEPGSRLQKITLFPNWASIARETTLSLKKGENIVRLSHLTPNLFDASVQINLEGQPDIRIEEVKVEETFLKKTEQPGVMKLQTELDNLNLQIREAMNQVAAIQSSSDYLKRVDPFPQTQKITPADMEAHTRYLEKSLATNFERIASIEIKLKKMNEEKVALENELNNLAPDKSRSKNILIRLWSPGEKNGTRLGFTYLTPDAGWSPQYEARADFNSAKISFTYFASVHQSTGEDWLGTDLEISTSQPFIYGNPPELTPWFLDIYTPRPVRAKSAMTLSGKPEQAMMMEAEEPQEIYIRGTAIREETTSFSFVIPRKVDIASDGEPHRIEIAASESKAEFSFFTIPKLAQNVFLKTTLKNPFSFPIQPGMMSVFLNQQLVGNTSVNNTIIPDDSLDLSLGVDQGIKIERKLQKKFTDYAGVLSKETTVNYEYLIEITNGKSKKVTLDLNDQFPISRNEKIKIEPASPKRGDATVDEEGKISWNITLSPGEKKSIPVKFSVTYPKEMTVSGL